MLSALSPLTLAAPPPPPQLHPPPQIKEWSEGGKSALMAAHVRSMLQPVPARQQ